MTILAERHCEVPLAASPQSGIQKKQNIKTLQNTFIGMVSCATATSGLAKLGGKVIARTSVRPLTVSDNPNGVQSIPNFANAEHSIKPFAKWRKKISKSLNKKNIETHLVLLSILQTCKYQGINFFEFLKSGKKSIYE